MDYGDSIKKAKGTKKKCNKIYLSLIIVMIVYSVSNQFHKELQVKHIMHKLDK